MYETCGAIAHGTRGLSDCHHGAFRWIENWIYAIGTGKWGIPSRKIGTERERLGRLLFGYALGIDNWLLERPMQFLLLDLGHVDFGFDPKNEILRVYAYLAEKTPVKEWLAACMWYKFVLEPPAEYITEEMRRILFIKEIQEAEYAVFSVQDNDTDKIKDAFQSAYKEWLPKSDYEATLGYDLEKYRHHPDKNFEIMIPVIKKSV